MKTCNVCVDLPISLYDEVFTYAIPQNYSITVGQAVEVPFGIRMLQGIVVDLNNDLTDVELKPIANIVESYPLISSKQIELAKLIKNYYKCSLFQAISLFLPPGFGRASLELLELGECEPEKLTDDEDLIVNALREKSPIAASQFVKKLGKEKARKTISVLLNRNVLKNKYTLDVPRIKPKYIKTYQVACTESDYNQAIIEFGKKRAFSRKRLLEYLFNNKTSVTLPELRAENYSSATLRSLVELNLVKEIETECIRGSLDVEQDFSHSFSLTSYQINALNKITTSISKQDGQKFLLYGVTGSGKTEVYLKATEECLKQNKRVIVLVPEITLATQIIQQFSSRFPNKCSVQHSGLTLGERYDQWRQIKRGYADIVIGARSALFAPMDDVGLIIIDEEHEYAYKQNECQPVYHAERVAETMCRMTGCTLVLGSATPDVSTFYAAKNNRIKLLTLPERIKKNTSLQYHIVDMRTEAKNGNTSVFSKELKTEIQKALSKKEQVILFLNRRGDGQFMQCYDCGHVIKCASCQVSMTYHSDVEKLICHRCGAKKSVPELCPNCGGMRLNTYGVGTQTLEREIRTLFPSAKYLRWDADSAKTKDASKKLLSRMNNREVDILVGTQAIAKGLHFPFVTVVGVINSDTMLNLPDFRACERTYQLISQVAGRAGRGDKQGKVIIQSYSPNNYAIQASSKDNYVAFYEQEIKLRKDMNYPPFSKIAIITCENIDETKCVQNLEKLKQKLNDLAKKKGVSINIVGPIPAFINRHHGSFRYEIMLRGQVNTLLDNLKLPKGYSINIDPLGL